MWAGPLTQTACSKDTLRVCELENIANNVPSSTVYDNPKLERSKMSTEAE